MTESHIPAFFNTPLSGSVRNSVHTADGDVAVRITRAALVKLAGGDESRTSIDIIISGGKSVDELCRGFVTGRTAPEGGWLLDAADIDGIVPLPAEPLPPTRYFDAPDVHEGEMDPAFKAWLDSNPRQRPIAEYGGGDVLLGFGDDADGNVYGTRKDDGTWVQFLDGEEIPLDADHGWEGFGDQQPGRQTRVPTHFCEIPFEAAVHYMML